MTYEERVLTVLSRWLGGDSLREAAREMSELAAETSRRSYEEGYRFAKDESRLVAEAVEACV
tara:strand:- start:3467 stop:3652 length:186 start_codon:yes stop_codon:yes gene_type:complete